MAARTREYTHADVLDIISRQQTLNYRPAKHGPIPTRLNLAAILLERVSGVTFAGIQRVFRSPRHELEPMAG
jgi:hypothetical protein